MDSASIYLNNYVKVSPTDYHEPFKASSYLGKRGKTPLCCEKRSLVGKKLL